MNDTTHLKRQVFAKEYLVDRNAIRATIRAGYSEWTAKQQGSRLLTFVDVRAEIAALDAARQEADQVDREFVINGLRDLALNASGESSRVRSYELLGKILGMFVEQVEAHVTHDVQALQEFPPDQLRVMLVEALDLMLTIQPWKRAGTALYYHSVRQGEMKFPYIPMLVETIDTDNNGNLISPYKLGAYAQLGLPAMVYFIRDERAFSIWHANLETDSEDHSKELAEFDVENPSYWATLCNWRQLAMPLSKTKHFDSTNSFTLKESEEDKRFDYI